MTYPFLKAPPQNNNASKNRSEAYLKAAVNYFDSACEQAQSGELQAAATLILKALDQERRAASVGPQVLQLIKPRT